MAETLVDKVKGKVASLKNASGSLFTAAYSLSDLIGDNLPALACEFDVYIETALAASGGIELPQMPYLCFFATDVSIPRTGWQFVPSPAGYGGIESRIAEGESIRVSYWDTKQFFFSRILENIYANQLTKDGTLRQDYKQGSLSIQMNHMIIHLFQGAFERPTPLSVSARSKDLLLCSFSFAYEDYRVLYSRATQSADGTWSYSFQDSDFSNGNQAPYRNTYSQGSLSEIRKKQEEEAAKKTAMSAFDINAGIPEINNPDYFL